MRTSEEHNAYVRDWYAKNREHRCAYMRQYRLDHYEVFRARELQRVASLGKEAIKEYNHNRYILNKEKKDG